MFIVIVARVFRRSSFTPQQNSHIQRDTQTNLDLWNKTVTYGLHFKHRNPRSGSLKVLSLIVDAAWYVPNTVILTRHQTPTVKEEIRHCSSQYSARLSVHPNDLVVNLMAQPDNRRLRRHMPHDQPTRFQLLGVNVVFVV
jgi:hypothetical protein